MMPAFERDTEAEASKEFVQYFEALTVSAFQNPAVGGILKSGLCGVQQHDPDLISNDPPRELFDINGLRMRQLVFLLRVQCRVQVPQI